MKEQVLAALLMLTAFGCSSHGLERRVVTEQWDTLGLITPTSVQDTTILEVHKVVSWNGNYAVMDGNDRDIRYVSKQGHLIWTFRKIGGGPGEVRSVITMHVGPNGRLWVYDAINVKLLELDEHGVVVRDRSLQHLPVTPLSFGFLGSRLVMTTQSPEPFILVLDTASLAIVRTFPCPWPEALAPQYNFRTSMAAGDSVLVAALEFGSGFLVLRGNQIHLHNYIDHIPWAMKITPQMQAARADSARYGAVSIAVDSGRIYMLFGGRPLRHAHPFEPTRFIDIYRTDGTYLESYRLPSHFKTMTRDGGNFVLTNQSGDGMPQIWRFAPVVSR